MNYVKYIFESEDVKSLVSSNESAIESVIRECVPNFVSCNFEYVVENLSQFIVSDNMADTFENIKQFITSDMVSLLSAVSEVAALDESFENIEAVISENEASVFTGAGYGTQKAERLISATYS